MKCDKSSILWHLFSFPNMLTNPSNNFTYFIHQQKNTNRNIPQTKSPRVSTDQNNIRFDGQQKNRCLKGYGPPHLYKYISRSIAPHDAHLAEKQQRGGSCGWANLAVGKFWTPRDSESCAIWKLFWRYSGLATILQHWKICIVTKWKGMETLLQAFCTFCLVQVWNQITKRIVKVTRQNIKRHTTGAR